MSLQALKVISYMNINGRTFRVKPAKLEYSLRKSDRHANYNEDFLKMNKSCFRVPDSQTEGFFSVLCSTECTFC